MLKFHNCRNLKCIEVIRVHPKYARAILTPTKSPVPTDQTVDVNLFHVAYTHQNEVLLKEMVKSLNMVLTGEMKRYYGCFMANGLRNPIPSSSRTQAMTKLERVYVDLREPKSIASRRGKR